MTNSSQFLDNGLSARMYIDRIFFASSAKLERNHLCQTKGQALTIRLSQVCGGQVTMAD
jgi:hypothetical protein